MFCILDLEESLFADVFHINAFPGFDENLSNNLHQNSGTPRDLANETH